MTNEVGIVLRVNTQESERLRAVVEDIKRQNKSLEADLQRALKLKETEVRTAARAADAQKTLNNQYTFAAAALAREADELAHAIELQRNLGREALRAAEDRARAAQLEMARAEAARKAEAKLAAEQAAEQRQQAANAAALQAFKIKTIGENEASEQGASAKALAEVERRAAWERENAAALQRFKIKTIGENETAEKAANARALSEAERRAAWERENAAALQNFKIKTIGETIDAEIAAQAKLDRLHAAALAEDIAREKARTSAIERERMKAASKFGTGALSIAGMGFGANALGAGIATALTVGYASKTSMEFERASQAIAAASGSLQRIGPEMAFVEQQSNRLGINVLQMAQAWSSFQAASKGSALEGRQSREIFLAVSEAAQKLNLRSEETEGALRALGQMMSKGKVQAEELRGQLGDRLPGAFNIMARALGVSTAQLDKMLQQGEVAADTALPKFAAELRKTFGTDANTSIDTTASNFTRLGNEIKFAAGALGDLVNAAASPSAGAIADIMRGIRMSFGSGLVSYAEAFGEKPALPAANADAVKLGADIVRAQSTRDRFAPGSAEWVSLNNGLIDQQRKLAELTQAARDAAGEGEEKSKKQLALERQRLAVGKELTKVQQLQQLIADGAYADDDKGTRAERMALAIEQDRAEATKQAVAAGKEATAQQEREISYSKQLWEAESTHNEQIKDGIRAQMARNAALSEELATGERVTNARKRALQVQLAQADVTGRSLESEMDIGDEKERQVALLREARQIADQAIREASRKSRRYRGGDARSYDDIAAEQRSAEDAENGDYLTKRMSLELSGKGTAEAEQALYADHQRKLTEIAREGEDARVALTRARADVVSGIFGNLANAAQMFGEKGFRAYKAFAIAEATASMISGAVGAFAQASKTYPPPFGQVMGGIAAGAVVASGIAQIAQIRSLSYGGGRELGGGVNERSFYEVGEKGRPELYEQDGKLYMIPGNNGRVTPASSMPAAQGKSAPVVRIENHGEPLNVRMKSLMGNVLTLEAVPAIVDQARVGARSDRMRDLESVGPETRYRQSREGTRTRPSRRRFA